MLGTAHDNMEVLIVGLLHARCWFYVFEFQPANQQSNHIKAWVLGCRSHCFSGGLVWSEGEHHAELSDWWHVHGVKIDVCLDHSPPWFRYAVGSPKKKLNSGDWII